MSSLSNLIKSGYKCSKINFKHPFFLIQLNSKFMTNNYLDMYIVNSNKECITVFEDIKKYEDFHNSMVVDRTQKAKELGINIGMMGKDVFDIYEKHEKLLLAHVITGI